MDGELVGLLLRRDGDSIIGLHHGPEGVLAGFQLLQLGAALVQLGLGAVQLGAAGFQFRIAVGDLLFVARQSPVKFVFSVVQLRLAPVDLQLGIRQLLLRVRQFRPAVFQFLRGVRQLLLGLRLLLLVLGPGVVQFRLGLVDDLLVPGLHPLVLDGLKALHHPVHLVLVGGGEGVQLLRALHREVEGGVIVHVKAGLRCVGEQANGARAGVGVLRFHREIGRRAHGAHHREGLGQRVGDALVVLGLVHRQHVADGGNCAGKVLGQAHGDLAGGAGHPPLRQRQLIQPVGLGQVLFGNALQPGGQALAAFAGEHQIHVPGGHHARNALHRPHGGKVLVGEALGGLYFDVVEIGLAAVLIGGKAHIHRRSQQAGKKAHAQRHDGENGHKAGKARPHRAQDGLSVCTVQQLCFTTRSVPPAWGWDLSRWRWPGRS